MCRAVCLLAAQHLGQRAAHLIGKRMAEEKNRDKKQPQQYKPLPVAEDGVGDLHLPARMGHGSRHHKLAPLLEETHLPNTSPFDMYSLLILLAEPHCPAQASSTIMPCLRYLMEGVWPRLTGYLAVGNICFERDGVRFQGGTVHALRIGRLLPGRLRQNARQPGFAQDSGE